MEETVPVSAERMARELRGEGLVQAIRRMSPPEDLDATQDAEVQVQVDPLRAELRYLRRRKMELEERVDDLEARLEKAERELEETGERAWKGVTRATIYRNDVDNLTDVVGRMQNRMRALTDRIAKLED